MNWNILSAVIRDNQRNHYTLGLVAEIYLLLNSQLVYFFFHFQIPFSFAIELWGPKTHKSASCFDLFNPPNEQLKVGAHLIQGTVQDSRPSIHNYHTIFKWIKTIYC